MRRAPLVIVILAALAVAPAWAQEAAPKLGARLAACETGTNPEQRFAVFTASMPAMAGTRRMGIRFDLEERRGPKAKFRRVAAAKWGRWDWSPPNARGWVFTKRLMNLVVSRSYRAVVRFRWRDAEGRIQRTARRVTPFCHQPDQRPDLQLESLSATRAGSYLVTIVNGGLSPAEASTVLVEPKQGSAAQRPVLPLAPGERTRVVVEAEPCKAGTTVVVELDRDRTVEESREGDNRVENDCPVPPESGSGGR